MKSVRGYFLLLVFVAVLSLSFVSAAASLTTIVGGFFSGFYDVARPFLELLTGVSAPTAAADAATIFYVRLLSMILIFAVVYATLKTSSFFEGWPLWVISLAVPILGVRFLKDEWLYTILVPQSTFAVVITAGLPFVLFFFVVRSIVSPTIRRIAWIFFGVVFLAMWSYYADSLAAASYVYPLTAFLAFIMAAFDGTIQGFLYKAQIERAQAGGRVSGLIGIDALLRKVEEDFAATGDGYAGKTPSTNGKSGVMAYRADIKYLQKVRSEILK